MEVKVLGYTSLIDGEYIVFVPSEPEKFEQNFDTLKSAIKKALGFELFRSDIGTTRIVTGSGIENTQVYYLQNVKDIKDMEEFRYSDYADVYMQVMVGKSVDGEIKLIEGIERKTVICFGRSGSGLTNLKTILEQEISRKRKHAKITEITNISDAGGVPTGNGVFLIDKVSEEDAEKLRDSANEKTIVIELLSKGFGMVYDRDTVTKIRAFKA